MKIAACYSGQIGAFHKALQNQKHSFLTDDIDLFLYTSSLVSQKENTRPNLPPVSEVHTYLPGGKGWRENLGTYGIIYKVSNDTINNQLMPMLDNKIQHLAIEDESLEDSLQDWDMSKWQWLRKRQLRKMYKCNELVSKSQKEYDIIVRCRFEFSPHVKIYVKRIIENCNTIENKIFMFGGWNCVPPMVFMDQFICDGFAFGTPRTMDIFTSLYVKKKPYKYMEKYKDCWNKFGDNVEYQLKKHLDKHDIEICFIGQSRDMYHLWR